MIDLSEVFQKVKGQREQIITLSLALTRKKSLLPNVNLMIGGTGSGKTFITTEVTNLLEDTKVVTIDATMLTAKGWDGGNHLDTDIINNLKNTHPEQQVIIIVDEIDKICRPSVSSSGTNHSFLIQNNFLKLIDGIKLKDFNTRNFIWVFCGAFEGMQEYKPKVGFIKENTDDVSIRELLINYGMRPELCGRILSIIQLDNVTTDMYRDYLCDPNSEFNQQVRDSEGSFFPNHAKIMTEAEENKLGMRGLLHACQAELDRHEKEQYNSKITLKKALR